jgi:hypothetical protein
MKELGHFGHLKVISVLMLPTLPVVSELDIFIGVSGCLLQ